MGKKSLAAEIDEVVAAADARAAARARAEAAARVSQYRKLADQIVDRLPDQIRETMIGDTSLRPHVVLLHTSNSYQVAPRVDAQDPDTLAHFLVERLRAEGLKDRVWVDVGPGTYHPKLMFSVRGPYTPPDPRTEID